MLLKWCHPEGCVQGWHTCSHNLKCSAKNHHQQNANETKKQNAGMALQQKPRLLFGKSSAFHRHAYYSPSESGVSFIQYRRKQTPEGQVPCSSSQSLLEGRPALPRKVWYKAHTSLPPTSISSRQAAPTRSASLLWDGNTLVFLPPNFFPLLFSDTGLWVEAVNEC